MKDCRGREINYLRLSLTERCTLKCAYCRANEGACPKQKELSAENLLRIVRVMASLGITKVRLTGGEPMLRKDLIEIISGVSSIGGITEIAMTTNGQHLFGQAKKLREAGLSRLNISLDSLNPARYFRMTGGGELALVLDGIDEALVAGFAPLKINVVLMRGENDDETARFFALAKDRPIDVRFIELMPMGTVDHGAQRVKNDELIAKHPELIPLPKRYRAQPSSDYTIEGYLGRIGFISPMSHAFCADCNRIRVMSDGMLRPCLGDNKEVSLLDALAMPGDEMLTEVIRRAIMDKPATNCFDSGTFHAEKDMSRIGG